MLSAGTLVGGRYELIAPLASGGMGTVWRARHTELEVEVALKLMSNELTSADAPVRFKREAQAAARLRSPNIVQMLDYGVFETQPYLVMGLMHGEDLADRLARVGSLDHTACIVVMDGVSRALQLAHDNGIVHRDLKPANVFLERVGDDEVVKVLDFGIAKDLSVTGEAASKTGGGVVGSPAYMAPEQINGLVPDHRTDIWAMGVLAYEMLTGINPFVAETLPETFMRIATHEMPNPRDSMPTLPVELDVFFARALAREPERRFPSAKACADAFCMALGGRPSAPSGVSPVPAEPINAHAATAHHASGAVATMTASGDDSALKQYVEFTFTASDRPPPAALDSEAEGGPATPSPAPMPWVAILFVLAAVGAALFFSLGGPSPDPETPLSPSEVVPEPAVDPGIPAAIAPSTAEPPPEPVPEIVPAAEPEPGPEPEAIPEAVPEPRPAATRPKPRPRRKSKPEGEVDPMFGVPVQ